MRPGNSGTTSCGYRKHQHHAGGRYKGRTVPGNGNSHLSLLNKVEAHK